MKYTLDQAQKDYDNQLPDDKYYCLRCDEEMDDDSLDHCPHCEEVIRRKNKNRDYKDSWETY